MSYTHRSTTRENSNLVNNNSVVTKTSRAQMAFADHHVNILTGYNRTLENSNINGRSHTPMTNNPKFSIIQIP